MIRKLTFLSQKRHYGDTYDNNNPQVSMESYGIRFRRINFPRKLQQYRAEDRNIKPGTHLSMYANEDTLNKRISIGSFKKGINNNFLKKKCRIQILQFLKKKTF